MGEIRKRNGRDIALTTLATQFRVRKPSRSTRLSQQFSMVLDSISRPEIVLDTHIKLQEYNDLAGD
jgi:hypothetical protein